MNARRDDIATGSPSSDDAQPIAGGSIDDVPMGIVRRLVRALNRSPSAVVALVDGDLKTRWLSCSAEWLTGTDPTSRKDRGALERVHPDDVPRLVYAYEQLKTANEETPGVAVIEPIRYRIDNGSGEWVTREALVFNLLHDPVVAGLLLVIRPVGGELDGVGHVVDLLVGDAPLPQVLGACASLVPAYLGGAAVVGLVDRQQVVGVSGGRNVDTLAKDDRWWRDCLVDGELRATGDFEGVAGDLAGKAREAGFKTVWVLPLDDTSAGEVMGCVVVWVGIETDLNIGTDHGILQTKRLASLVIGEQRRHFALQRAAATDPLTGVANRSALRRRLDAASGAVTVVLIDLDGFKAVNDNHGHDAGDAVLQVVAQRLVAAVREDDLVVRLGGDEFAVVVADDPTEGHAPHDPRRLGARIQEAVEGPLRLGPTLTIPIHASVGVATAAAHEVIQQADAALYGAKRSR